MKPKAETKFKIIKKNKITDRLVFMIMKLWLQGCLHAGRQMIKQMQAGNFAQSKVYECPPKYCRVFPSLQKDELQYCNSASTPAYWYTCTYPVNENLAQKR